MLSPEDREKIEKVLKKYESDPGPLISVLQEVQGIFGYLPREALSYICKRLKVSESQVWGIVTFYSQFYLEPRGKNTIRVCLGTACHVRGASRILSKLQEVLGINPGETTPDLKFSLETVRCLGTCFLAPVMMINSDYFGKMTPGRVEQVLAQY